MLWARLDSPPISLPPTFFSSILLWLLLRCCFSLVIFDEFSIRISFGNANFASQLSLAAIWRAPVRTFLMSLIRFYEHVVNVINIHQKDNNRMRRRLRCAPKGFHPFARNYSIKRCTHVRATEWERCTLLFVYCLVACQAEISNILVETTTQRQTFIAIHYNIKPLRICSWVWETYTCTWGEFAGISRFVHSQRQPSMRAWSPRAL